MQRIRECLAELFKEIERRHMEDGRHSQAWLAGLRAVAESAAHDELGIDRNPAEYGSLRHDEDSPRQVHVFSKAPGAGWHLLITMPKEKAGGGTPSNVIEITAPRFGYSNRLDREGVILKCGDELNRLAEEIGG